MATPTQQGTALKLLAVPTFSDFIVVDEKWEVTDATGVEETIGGDSKTANFTMYNPGSDIAFEWVVKSTGAATSVGLVVADGAGNKYFVNAGLKTSYRGGKPAKQSGTLTVRESVTLA